MNFADVEFSTIGLKPPRPSALPSKAADANSLAAPTRENRRRILTSFCGRSTVADRYYRFLISRLGKYPGQPLVCFLYGSPAASHASFISRLVEVGIREEVHRLFGPEQGILKFSNQLSWPRYDPLPERRSELLGEICGSIEFNSQTDLTPDVLAAYLHQAKIQSLVLHQIIPLGSCDAVAMELLKWYLEFWHKFPVMIGNSQIFVFLDFQTQARNSTNPLSKIWLKRMEKKALREIKEIARRPPSGLPVFELGELPLIERAEVSLWFKQYTDFQSSEIADRVARIFPPLVSRLDLHTIEQHLFDIPQTHLKEGAIDDIRKRFRALRRSWQHAG